MGLVKLVNSMFGSTKGLIKPDLLELYSLKIPRRNVRKLLVDVTGEATYKVIVYSEILSPHGLAVRGDPTDREMAQIKGAFGGRNLGYKPKKGIYRIPKVTLSGLIESIKDLKEMFEDVSIVRLEFYSLTPNESRRGINRDKLVNYG